MVPYLRVSLTEKCPMACGFCHAEGDRPGEAASPTPAEWISLVSAAIHAGARKVKFLGGEPLVYRALPQVIAGVRAADPAVDLSLITSGVGPVRVLEEAFAAGLDRANMSIHGFGERVFADRSRSPSQRVHRDQVLRALLRRGRPLKLNYVYTGPGDDADLADLLDWSAGRPLVVNVLDDLFAPELGPAVVEGAVIRLHGVPTRVTLDHDPYSLSTRHLHWADGLEVEIKHQHLGETGSFAACATCPVRARCREGIRALRLSRDGQLRPCMDRPDLAVDLLTLLRRDGAPAVRAALATAVTGFVGDATCQDAQAASSSPS